MPAWLIPILGLLGGEAVHRGGKALLMKLIGQAGKETAHKAVGSAAARVASRIPTQVGKRFLTPQRLSGAALTTGGILGGAAAFGVGNETVSGLLSPEPYTPYGAESLMGAPVGDAFPDIESLLSQMNAGGDEEDDKNDGLETLIRGLPEQLAGGRLI